MPVISSSVSTILPHPVSHTAIVDSNFGNDATGVVGDKHRPFQTINAAINAINAAPIDSGLVHIQGYDHTWDLQDIDTDKTISIFAEPTTRIQIRGRDGATSHGIVYSLRPDGDPHRIRHIFLGEIYTYEDGNTGFFISRFRTINAAFRCHVQCHIEHLRYYSFSNFIKGLYYNDNATIDFNVTIGKLEGQSEIFANALVYDGGVVISADTRVHIGMIDRSFSNYLVPFYQNAPDFTSVKIFSCPECHVPVYFNRQFYIGEGSCIRSFVNGRFRVKGTAQFVHQPGVYPPFWPETLPSPWDGADSGAYTASGPGLFNDWWDVHEAAGFVIAQARFDFSLLNLVPGGFVDFGVIPPRTRIESFITNRGNVLTNGVSFRLGTNLQPLQTGTLTTGAVNTNQLIVSMASIVPRYITTFANEQIRITHTAGPILSQGEVTIIVRGYRT